MPGSVSVISNRKLLILILCLALTVGASCTSGELPLATQIEGDEAAADGTALPGANKTAPPRGGATHLDAYLLVCNPQPYAITTAVIGPNGGQISLGDHSLKIAQNALSEDVTITAEQIEGLVNSVRFSPEGLRFAVPAVLTLSYQNCANVRDPKRIVNTDESLNILQSLPSLDLNPSSQVKTLIDDFSRYAVAY
jgi:hypothetical protein